MNRRDRIKEKRKHHRLTMGNIVVPVNLVYLTEEGKEQKVLAVLSDLSASGMRMVSFLEAPFSGNIFMNIDLPGMGEMKIKGKTSWVTKKQNIFTVGIEFLEISDENVKKISSMAEDYVDCDTRVLLRLPEVCVSTCRAHTVCSKVQKDDILFGGSGESK